LASTRITSIDALLLLMVLIWGTNYAIIKSAFRELEPQAFNAIRMTLGSLVFLAIIVGLRHVPVSPISGDGGRSESVASVFRTPESLTRSDWVRLALLGIVGHALYQYLFIGGLARTTVANSSLLLAATPVVIALLSAAMGEERIGRMHWIGAGLSVAGIYAIIGRGFTLDGSSVAGDVMMAGAVCCWTVYTLGARPLIARHSPVGVTGLSMAIGTALYIPLVSRHIAGVQWGKVSAITWLAAVYSALFALCVAYTIWYAAVRELGSARTSAYSNLIPIVAMLSAVIVLGEPLGLRKILGAAAVLGGIALTRIGGTRVAIPAEE
jgi:drug/metabolite transporter (DMT)-like permease